MVPAIPIVTLPRALAKLGSAVLIVAGAFLWPGDGVQTVMALDDGLARTPPMGWNNWYAFGCAVNEQIIRETAAAMAANGMKSAGYTYVNIDDCWQVGRDSSGTIAADPVKFPSGIRALADYVHGLGLKLGIYTDAGTATCAGRPGSLGYEDKDMLTYAQWRVDFVKVDWCNTSGLDPKTQYAKFRDAIVKATTATGQKMVFSICNWGVASPWTWGPQTGHMWRMAGDIPDRWLGFLRVVDKNEPLHPYARPGAWNDPDILQVGRAGMTDVEYRSQFSLWAMMAAPLLAGNDIRAMSAYTKETLTNSEVIAVDQDPLGVQGRVVRRNPSNDLQVWSRPLQPRVSEAGKAVWAVALFNRMYNRKEMTVIWRDLGLVDGSVVAVRDLWAHQDLALAQWSRTGYTVTVPQHGIIVLRVVGTAVQ